MSKEQNKTEVRNASELMRLLYAHDFEEEEEAIVCNARFYLHIENIGTFTILDRETGFSFVSRDVETGFRDMDGNFWLASGMFDIRKHLPLKVDEAIDMVKDNANTCKGV